ncbi:helix-turn-helix domain-containing protein [Modestobacter sp. SSW1-42]|uniref:helix-turn-helix domain-containing protein n=1 Tax=Modestobacter sp. SSW1-42 TaxID=596372 RepID=UPI0039868BDA
MDRMGQSAEFPARRPTPVGLSPVTAWVLDVYLRTPMKADFRTWVSGLRPSPMFPPEARATVLKELDDLAFTGGWHRQFLMSDVGQTDTLTSDIAGSSEHDEELSTAEAAAMLNVQSRTVLRWLEQGLLTGRRVNPRSVRVSRASVAAFRETRAA